MKTAASPFRAVLSSVVASVLWAACPSLGQTQVVWDLQRDWSDSANPHGPWALLEGGNLLPQGTRADGDRTVPQIGWAEGGSNDWLPFWFRSNGSETFPADVLAGDVVVHTTDPTNGVGNGPAAVTWTSPLTGTVSLSGGVWMVREIGRSNDWRLYKNGLLLTGGSIASGDPHNRANVSSFAAGTGGPTAAQNVVVTEGDVLKLELVRASGAGDYVGVRLRIVAGAVWNTGSGANGHTYIPVKVPAGITWQEAEEAAVATGGHLVGISSAEENAFVHALVAADGEYWSTNGSGQSVGPWLGGVQSPSGLEPGGGWQWTEGYGVTFTNWAAGRPDNGHGGTDDRMVFSDPGSARSGHWDDYPAAAPPADLPKSYVIELGGVGGGSTAWQSGAGANGHSYEAVLVPGGITWAEAEAAAIARGGHLASIGSAEENAFVFSLVRDRPEFWYTNVVNYSIGPFIGGYQADGSAEPGGGYLWSDGTPLTYTNWRGGEPNNSGGTEKFIHLYGGSGPEPFWNDVNSATPTNGYVVEYDIAPGVISGPDFADMLYVTAGPAHQVLQYRVHPVEAPSFVRSLATDMNVPSGLALSGDGELFVVQRGAGGAQQGRVSRFSDAARLPVPNGSLVPSSPPLDFSHGAAFRGSELLVVDSGHDQVRRFRPVAGGGFAEQQPPVTAGLSGGLARYVAVHPTTQEIFVSHAGGPNKILRFIMSGDGSVAGNGEITGNGMANPHGMAFSPWGELFVANYDGASVSRFSFGPDGAAVANGTITGNGLSGPVGVVFSPWHELFVGNSAGESISRFTFAESGSATANGSLATPVPASMLQFVRASAPAIPPPCVPGVTTSVTEGLIGWWKGDGNADDATGKNPGTEENGVTYEPGRFGEAFRVGMAPPLEYDSGARVNLGHLPQLKGAAAWTVSAWLKVDSSFSPAAQLIGLPVGAIPAPPPPPGPAVTSGLNPSHGRGLYCTGFDPISVTSLALGSGVTFSTQAYAPNPPDHEWKHIASVWRSSDGFCATYIDGVLTKEGKATAGSRFPDGSGDLAPGYIGAFSFVLGTTVVTNPSSLCLWDDVRVYTRDLTSEEISLIATGEDFNTCPPADLGIPPLAAVRTAEGVRVSWPSRFTGWFLEASLDLADWSPITGTPAVQGDDFVMMAPSAPSWKFFRLRQSGN